jgi:hypothetical protein
MSLEDAKKFLAQIKKEGMNGIISKGGKPVKEELDDEDKPVVKKVVKMLKKASQAHAGQADDLEKSMKEHHEKDANGEPIPHDDEEDIEEARKSYDDVEMRKKLKTPKHANRKTAGDEKKERELAQRKKLGLEEVEVDEKASDYEDQIKAFLAKGGKVQKGDKPNKKKIDKVSKDFMKKLGVMKKKEAELDAKAKAELEKMMGEETLDEANYELYHKDFSSAMQHAYAHAKKQGFTVDPEEIDNKVATGPRKPSKGKTNRYILGTDKKKKVHIQVANLDNKRFELNMYIEETELEEGKMGDSDQQHNALVATKAKMLMKQALKSGKSQSQAWWNKQAKLAGLMETPEKENMDIEETIKQVVEGKYNKKKMEDASNDKSDDGEGMDKVDPKAVKKKFKDRKDKDLDNDGDTDGSDEYLHKKRKAISKSMEKEETDSPLYSHVKRLLRNK